ncbi:MAG: class I SAM-dependent methyltransferase [Burkholderiales bacterium]
MEPRYDKIGRGYAGFRRPDPRIAAAINAQLGDARSILNIGAGSGSYEPMGRELVAVEPSSVMIAQRASAAPVIQACAEALPFADGRFDCSMALLSIHHWSNIELGLLEAIRVTRDRLVLFTWLGFDRHFWLFDYLPAIRAIDEEIFPKEEWLRVRLGKIDILPVSIPHDCVDGFMGAYWRRPSAYLDAGVRRAISTFSRLGNIDSALVRLQEDLASGEWRRRYGELMRESSFDLGYRLVVLHKDR